MENTMVYNGFEYDLGNIEDINELILVCLSGMDVSSAVYSTDMNLKGKLLERAEESRKLLRKLITIKAKYAAEHPWEVELF